MIDINLKRDLIDAQINQDIELIDLLEGEVNIIIKNIINDMNELLLNDYSASMGKRVECLEEEMYQHRIFLKEINEVKKDINNILINYGIGK